MEDFLDRLNWSYVIVAIGIFMGCLLISLVLLYGHTKDRWDWGKPLRFLGSRIFLMVMLLVVVGVVVYPPLKRMSVVAYERKEAARRDAEEAKEMELRRSERMISLGEISLGMKEEEILLRLGHPSEEKSWKEGTSEHKALVYLKNDRWTGERYVYFAIWLEDGVCRSVRTDAEYSNIVPISERGARPIWSTSCLTPYEPADDVEAKTEEGAEPRQIRSYFDNNLEVEEVRGSIRSILVMDWERLSEIPEE